MVGCAGDWILCVNERFECAGKLLSCGIENCKMIEAGRALRWSRSTLTCPGVEADVMMIPASRKKHRGKWGQGKWGQEPFFAFGLPELRKVDANLKTSIFLSTHPSLPYGLLLFTLVRTSPRSSSDSTSFTHFK